MVEVLNDVQEQASMLEWHREDAVVELLRLKQPDPQIRHSESLTSYVDVRLLPKEGVVWSGGIMPEQLVVEKRCFGGRYELIQHEKAVLESLRTDRIGDAVFGMVGQFEYSDSTHDDPLIGVRLQYGGLDLSKWNQICYSNDSRLDPFCQAPFLLQLARRVLGCLFVFHRNGYIHCDLKLDNICARTRRVSRQGDYLVGAIDLQTLKLIDFGLSICRRRLDNGMLAVISAPPKWAARRRNSNGADADSLLISAEGTWANYLSDEYIDAFGQPDRASRIDGRVDLYSLASWLRQLCYVYDAESTGIGPWPSARLRKELVGTEKERELLQALPNMVHEAYRLFNPDDLPHVDIMSRIDKVVGHKPWEWPFEVPIGVTGPQLLQRRERAACTLMTTLHQDVLVDLPAPAELRLLVENARRDEHRAESPIAPLPAGETADLEEEPVMVAPSNTTPKTLLVPPRMVVAADMLGPDAPDSAAVPSDSFAAVVEDSPQAEVAALIDALGVAPTPASATEMESNEPNELGAESTGVSGQRSQGLTALREALIAGRYALLGIVFTGGVIALSLENLQLGDTAAVPKARTQPVDEVINEPVPLPPSTADLLIGIWRPQGVTCDELTPENGRLKIERESGGNLTVNGDKVDEAKIQPNEEGWFALFDSHWQVGKHELRIAPEPGDVSTIFNRCPS